MKPRVLMTVACVAAAMLAAAPAAHAEWVNRVTDGIMGTRITVEVWSEERAKAETAIDAVLDEMRHIDESMSTYKPTSEVSLVNAKAASAAANKTATTPTWTASGMRPRFTAIGPRRRCGLPSPEG